MATTFLQHVIALDYVEIRRAYDMKNEQWLDFIKANPRRYYLLLIIFIFVMMAFMFGIPKDVSLRSLDGHKLVGIPTTAVGGYTGGEAIDTTSYIKQPPKFSTVPFVGKVTMGDTDCNMMVTYMQTTCADKVSNTTCTFSQTQDKKFCTYSGPLRTDAIGNVLVPASCAVKAFASPGPGIYVATNGCMDIPVKAITTNPVGQ